MAENKKVVMVYTDWLEKFEVLEDDEAGRLAKHFFRYINDLNPTAPDRITKLSFIDIENTLKRDLKKWEGTKEKRSEAGIEGNLKRWNKDLYEEYKSSKITIEEALTVAENRKASQSNKIIANIAVKDNATVIDTVTDTATVKANVNDILLKKETKDNTPNGVVDLKNQPEQPKIDFNNLLSFFNSNRGLLPEVKKMSDIRKKRILVLEKQYGRKSIQTVITKTRDSTFLQGDNKDNWVASFDWIFKPANFLKILEDNYANKQNTRSIHSQRTDADHKQSAVDAVNAMFGV